MFKKVTLDNGLRILTAPMQGTNTVTVLVMCATGSDFERREEQGISHFLEHMFFKGTKNRPSAEIIRTELDAIGAISNAFTDHETTGYFIKAGKTYCDQVLEMLADIYKDSLLPEAEIEREKQVVVEELHLRRDTPTTHVGDLWERHLYGDQPAGWDIGGNEEVIRRLARDDLGEYFTHQYVAGNTAVVVAGNFDETGIRARVTELFGGIRHAPPRSKPPVAEDQSSPRIFVEDRKTDQTHLIAGFRSYDAFHPRRHAADILATILGGSWSSRMFSRIREELGLAYAVASDTQTYSNRGCLSTYAGMAHANVAKALQAVLDEYRRIREEAVGADELMRNRDFLKGRMLMSLEASNAVASFVGGEEMLTGKPLTTEEIFAIIDGVTPADIQAAAQDLFRRERLNLAVLGLSPDADRLQTMLDSFV